MKSSGSEPLGTFEMTLASCIRLELWEFTSWYAEHGASQGGIMVLVSHIVPSVWHVTWLILAEPRPTFILPCQTTISKACQT